MKMNNKGFTVIELVLSFVLVMFLSISMFALVNNYRDREEREAVKKSLLALKNTVTTDIYQDTIERKVKNIEYCRNSSDVVIDGCIEINFMDGVTKTLEIATERVTINDEGHYFTFDCPYILYGGVKYSNPYPGFTNIESDYMLTYTTNRDDLEYGTLYRINLRLTHQDITDEFVINIVTTGIIQDDLI